MAVPTGRLGSPLRRAALLGAQGRLKPPAAARRAARGWWWWGPFRRRLWSRRSARRPAQPTVPRLVARHHGGTLLPRPDLHGLPEARLPRAQAQAVLPPRRAALRGTGTSIVIVGGHGRNCPRMGVDRRSVGLTKAHDSILRATRTTRAHGQTRVSGLISKVSTVLLYVFTDLLCLDSCNIKNREPPLAGLSLSTLTEHLGRLKCSLSIVVSI